MLCKCGNDPTIISGESGAAGLGLIVQLMQDQPLEHAKNMLKLDAGSRVLVINTEGDTDPESYQRIIRQRYTNGDGYGNTDGD